MDLPTAELLQTLICVIVSLQLLFEFFGGQIEMNTVAVYCYTCMCVYI